MPVAVPPRNTPFSTPSEAPHQPRNARLPAAHPRPGADGASAERPEAGAPAPSQRVQQSRAPRTAAENDREASGPRHSAVPSGGRGDTARPAQPPRPSAGRGSQALPAAGSHPPEHRAPPPSPQAAPERPARRGAEAQPPARRPQRDRRRRHRRGPPRLFRPAGSDAFPPRLAWPRGSCSRPLTVARGRRLAGPAHPAGRRQGPCRRGGGWRQNARG